MAVDNIKAKNKKQISNWLITYVSHLVEMSPEDVATDVTFDSYGIDSTGAAGLSGDLSNWLGCSLNASLIHDYPTIDAVSQYLYETFFENK